MSGLIVGRDGELATIGERLAGRPEGLQVLLIEGEPGIGKTTVWQAGVDQATQLGYRVLACRAAQAETRMSFAGLGDLLAHVGPDSLAPLPQPQRVALERALLRLEAGRHAPPPHAIGAGLLSALSAIAERQPVLIAIDDLQWLDRPTIGSLAFALRRLEASPVIVLATVRAGDAQAWPASLGQVTPDRVHRIRLGPLSLAALFEILRPWLGQALTRPLLGSIQTASRGNPFYALELARAVADEPTASAALPVLDDVTELAARRLRRLPGPARAALLRASAQAQPTTATVDATSLEPAIEAGIVRIHEDGRVEFTHPLFAAAVYASATRDARRRLHAELATASLDIEERARHLALASDGPDPRLADLLDRASDHALSRGAPEVAADLAERAARRTMVDAGDAKPDRLLRAARHSLKAGDLARARALGEEILAATEGGRIRARALHLLAEARAFVEGPAASIALLIDATGEVGDDVALSAELETSLGWLLLGSYQLPSANEHLARAADMAARAGDQHLLSQVLAMRAMATYQLGLGVDEGELDRALALQEADRDDPFQRLTSMLVAQVFEFTGRFERADALLAELRQRVVARGDEGDLAYVVVHQGATALLAGDLARSEQLADEGLQLATLAGQELWRVFALSLRSFARAWRGDLAAARTDATDTLRLSERLGWPVGVMQGRWALAVVALAEDDPLSAVAWLDPVVEQVEAIGVFEWAIAMAVPDAIEALIATGDVASAARLTDRLAETGHRLDRPWALALSWRGRALQHAAAGDLEEAQAAIERALVEHERLPMRLELGRSLLVLGQIERRRGARRAARETLRQAEKIFDEIGARIWADRARIESHRIGVRRAPTELTDNERNVAELAAEGLSNREIAARTFMSRRTVEANLSRAYGKLGVRSRTELARRMVRSDGADW